LPHTHFPNGVTGGTKLAGHEMNGIILVLLILYKMKDAIDIKEFWRTLFLWVDEALQKHVGMEVVAEITLCSKDGDSGFKVFNAQAAKSLLISFETKAWQQAITNQVSSRLAFPSREPAWLWGYL
jgi:hypothetical protein